MPRQVLLEPEVSIKMANLAGYVVGVLKGYDGNILVEVKMEDGLAASGDADGMNMTTREPALWETDGDSLE